MAELTTLARPYAKAAFEYADANNILSEWAEMLGALATVVAEEKVAKLLSDPAATSEQNASSLIEIMGDTLNAKGQNFVRNVAANKRIQLFGEISTLFDLLKSQREQVLDVEITSAYEIKDNEQSKLSEALSKNLNRQVTLTCETDASLIGGVLIHAGDTFIDGSVSGRLAKLADAMNS